MAQGGAFYGSRTHQQQPRGQRMSIFFYELSPAEALQPTSSTVGKAQFGSSFMPLLLPSLARPPLSSHQARPPPLKGH